MLKVYCGNDSIKVRQEAFDFVATAEEQGVRVNTIEAEHFQTGILEDALGATSLFGGQELYMLDMPSSKEEFATAVKEALPAMTESSNQFVIIEGALLAAQKKPYQKYAEEFFEFKATAAERFNTFSLTDALLRKDKKSLWLLYTQAKQQGISDEEVIGVLWWQLKSLRLAALTTSAAVAGMKEFPYKKSKQALSKFKEGEVDTLSESLLRVYHEGHAGMREIDLALERWVLTI